MKKTKMSSLETKTRLLEVRGVSSKSKKEAVESAFANLQKIVKSEEKENVIVYMKPTDVELVDSKDDVRIDKYLGVFLPRERHTYSVTLKVEIEITILKV